MEKLLKQLRMSLVLNANDTKLVPSPIYAVKLFLIGFGTNGSAPKRLGNGTRAEILPFFFRYLFTSVVIT